MVMKPIRLYIVLYMEPFLMQGCGRERLKPLQNNDRGNVCTDGCYYHGIKANPMIFSNNCNS